MEKVKKASIPKILEVKKAVRIIRMGDNACGGGSNGCNG